MWCCYFAIANHHWTKCEIIERLRIIVAPNAVEQTQHNIKQHTHTIQLGIQLQFKHTINKVLYATTTTTTIPFHFVWTGLIKVPLQNACNVQFSSICFLFRIWRFEWIWIGCKLVCCTFLMHFSCSLNGNANLEQLTRATNGSMTNWKCKCLARKQRCPLRATWNVIVKMCVRVCYWQIILRQKNHRFIRNAKANANLYRNTNANAIACAKV